MFRRVAGPITCCLLLSWGVVAAPRKDDPASSYYLASKIGDKWVMAMDDGDQRWENVVEVTEVRQQDDILVVKLRDPSDTGGPCRFEVSNRGVYKVTEGVDGGRFCYVRLPFNKGDTWETTAKNRLGDTVIMRYTSAGEEEIEVPAGKFRCLRVEEECVVRGVTWTASHWMAPRVGTVKSVLVGKDGEGKLADYVCFCVLKSFTAGSK